MKIKNKKKVGLFSAGVITVIIILISEFEAVVELITDIIVTGLFGG